MPKTFRSWDLDQGWLLPPSVRDFVPPDHVAHFVRDTVREDLDLSAILGTYIEERGYPPYHPAMVTALLLYSYCQGVYSSRRIAQACEQRVDVMAVTALQKPDFRTISDFRKRHLRALGELFQQVLALCERAGLVRLGHVALDGTKMKANASKHKAMSYGRMKQAEPQLEKEVSDWFAKAEAADAAEDEEFGRDRRGDELPAWVTDRKKRLEKIREAKKALEEEARQVAQAAPPDDDPPKRPGRRPRKRSTTPDEKAQRNFTDPDSRIMMDSSGFQQAYNCHVAVDAESQVIVARDVTNQQSDVYSVTPLVAQIKTNTGRQTRELSADAGFCSEENLKELARRHIRGYVATGRQKHGTRSATMQGRPRAGPRSCAMRTRLKRGGFRSRYRLRKQTVEPVFGQIKEARGFRRFLLRGLPRVAEEWSLLCTAHNLQKLARAAA